VPELAAAGIVGSSLYNATVTHGVAAPVGTLSPTNVAGSAAIAVALTATITVAAWPRVAVTPVSAGRRGHAVARRLWDLQWGRLCCAVIGFNASRLIGLRGCLTKVGAHAGRGGGRIGLAYAS